MNKNPVIAASRLQCSRRGDAPEHTHPQPSALFGNLTAEVDKSPNIDLHLRLHVNFAGLQIDRVGDMRMNEFPLAVCLAPNIGHSVGRIRIILKIK
jgi:hypothetical protein